MCSSSVCWNKLWKTSFLQFLAYFQGLLLWNFHGLLLCCQEAPDLENPPIPPADEACDVGVGGVSGRDWACVLTGWRAEIGRKWRKKLLSWSRMYWIFWKTVEGAILFECRAECDEYDIVFFCKKQHLVVIIQLHERMIADVTSLLVK